VHKIECCVSLDKDIDHWWNLAWPRFEPGSPKWDTGALSTTPRARAHAASCCSNPFAERWCDLASDLKLAGPAGWTPTGNPAMQLYRWSWHKGADAKIFRYLRTASRVCLGSLFHHFCSLFNSFLNATAVYPGGIRSHDPYKCQSPRWQAETIHLDHAALLKGFD
jgi:hypothetical protein